MQRSAASRYAMCLRSHVGDSHLVALTLDFDPNFPDKMED